MDKFKMQLTWHSCTNYLPEEDYNPCLYVTDGTSIQPMRWKRDLNWSRFENGGWYIEPGINSDGYWWADLQQTIQLENKLFNASEDDMREFEVKICDTNIDEAFECFTYHGLCELERLVIGKNITLPDGSTAEIYKTKIDRNYSKDTIVGDYLYELKCWAKTTSTYGKTGDKVYIGCSVAHNTCSICGKEHCEHKHSKIYDGQLCYGVLTGVEDIYDIVLKD